MRTDSPGRGPNLRTNLLANYLGQLYAGSIALLMVPVYLRWFGAEAYGLIGFFTLLQAWAQILDLGLSAAVAREAARFRAGLLQPAAFRRVLRVFEYMFWVSGLLLACGLAWQAEAIAHRWLGLQQLAPSEVERSLHWIALAVALGWVPNVYRGVIMGVERQVWFNGFNAAINTLRYVVVVPVVLALGGSVVEFAAFQVFVSALELGGLWRKVSATTGRRGPVALAGAWTLAAPALRFAASVAVATVVWIAVTQSDRLVLSTVLPLSEYGWFTATAGAASVVAMLTFALSQALTPRLTAIAQGSHPELLQLLYRRATRLAAAVGTPLTLLLVVAPRELLWVWTGDAALAQRYAGVLSLYAAGNGFLLLAGLPYCLQYAVGNLRLHVVGNLLLGAAAIPALLLVAPKFGAVGTGWVWLAVNAAWLMLWTPLVHRRFAPGLHPSWLGRDIVAVAAPGCALAAVLYVAGLPMPGSRPGAALLLVTIALALLACSIPALRGIRQGWAEPRAAAAHE